MKDIHAPQKNQNKKDFELHVPKNRNRNAVLVFVIVLLSIIFGVGGGILGDKFVIPYLATLPQFQDSEFITSKGTTVTIQKTEINEVKDGVVFSDAIQKARPSVVSVYSAQDRRVLFEDIVTIEGGATGVVVAADGVILTSKSAVLEIDTEDYYIATPDGKEYPVERVTKDPLLDIVFLKINADNLSPVELALSDEIAEGDRVLAFGGPAQKELKKIYSDIISSASFSLSRDTRDVLQGVIALQDEYPLEYSGAPVVGLDGKLLGLLSVTDNQGVIVQSVIPVEYVDPILPFGISGKQIIRPNLGISYIDISPEFAALNNLSVTSGALVVSSENPDIFVPGDVIVGVNQDNIDMRQSFSQLYSSLFDVNEISFIILRNSAEVEIVFPDLD